MSEQPRGQRPLPPVQPRAITTPIAKPIPATRPGTLPGTGTLAGVQPQSTSMRAPSEASTSLRPEVPPPLPSDERADSFASGPVGAELRRLGREIRGEIRTAVRSAVDEALAPVLRSQQEALARLERELATRLDLREDALRAALGRIEQAPRPAYEPTAQPLTSATSATSTGNTRAATSLFAATPAGDTRAATSLSAATPAGDTRAATSLSAAPAGAPAGGVAFAPLVLDTSPLGVDLPSELDGSRRHRRMVWLIFVMLVLGVGAVLAVTLASQLRGS